LRDAKAEQMEAEAEAARAQAMLLAAKKELEQAVKNGEPVEMSSENAAAILDGTSNIFIKVRAFSSVSAD
jgi:hypothetical protein